MNAIDRFNVAITDDDLVQIARRADELAQKRASQGDAANDWECWVAAEREVLGRRDEP
jgi:hypothetical protein